MDFGQLMTKLGDSVAARDGKALAECFTPDGVYDDVFYGAFQGPEAIADMLENYFHRDGTNFRWDFHDPVSDGKIGYARYVFSYESKLADAAGKRTIFEGISVVRLEDGLLAEYKEIANTAVGLHLLGFAPERLAKILAKEAAELISRDESKGHMPG